jgi:hypothetical protein
MSAAEAETHCRDVGIPRPALDSDEGSIHTRVCDHVEVEPDLQLNVIVGLCGGDARLCEVSYWTNRNAASAFRALSAKLVARYGNAPMDNSTLRDEGLAEQCAKGDGKIRRTWWWGEPPTPTGRVLVSFDCKHGTQMTTVHYGDARGTATQLEWAKAHGP